MLKSILIALILSISFTAGAAERPSNKTQHFGASFAISSLVYIGARSQGSGKIVSIATATGAAMFLGLALELHQARIDKHDLRYDAYGAVAAPFFWMAFE